MAGRNVNDVTPLEKSLLVPQGVKHSYYMTQQLYTKRVNIIVYELFLNMNKKKVSRPSLCSIHALPISKYN